VSSDERNLKHRPGAIQALNWNSCNQRVTLEQSVPDGRKVGSCAVRCNAKTNQISRRVGQFLLRLPHSTYARMNRLDRVALTHINAMVRRGNWIFVLTDYNSVTRMLGVRRNLI